ncbi:hypothetical protein AA313_de0207826 [Arthrobotrys entomopaga]|nr:hypothetical protein AA313_de0207826 [Arthrobotrys entomopaga]
MLENFLSSFERFDTRYSLAIIASALVVFYIISCIYQLYFSPLAKVPGPWYAALSKGWFLTMSMRGNVSFVVHKLHQKYGPYVRIAPNEISVADLESVKKIHSIHDIYPKSKFYEALSGGLDHINVVTDHEEYKRRRRDIGDAFSNSNMTDLEPIVRKHIDTCVRKLNRELENDKTLNIMEWIQFTVVDVIGEISFGRDFGMLENEIVDLIAFVALLACQAYLPIIGLLKLLSTYIPNSKLVKVVQSGNRLLSYAQEALANLRHEIQCKRPRPSLFSKILAKVKDTELKSTMTMNQIRDEAFVFIIAGSDTTVITLTFIIWAIIRNAEVRQKVKAELDGLLSDCDDLSGINDAKVRDLQYFNSVINEGIRLYIAAQIGLPRVVPSGNGGRQLGPYFLPTGTEVSTPIFTIQRDSELFPEPFSFKPERWLNATDDMKAALLGFGGSSRPCIGRNLAMMEIRLFLALMFISCPNVGLADSCTDESMEINEFLLLNPKGHKCELKKVPIGNSI